MLALDQSGIIEQAKLTLEKQIRPTEGEEKKLS